MQRSSAAKKSRKTKKKKKGAPQAPEDVSTHGPAAADEDELLAEQFSAVIDSQLGSPAALEAARASLERLLPQE